MASARIPDTADLIGRVVVEKPEGRASMTAYRGYASKGYRSDYERVPTYWLAIVQPWAPTVDRHSVTPKVFAKHVAASIKDLNANTRADTVITERTGIYA